VPITGKLTVVVVVTEIDGLSTLVAVIVYVPTAFGEVHTFPTNVPALAVHVTPFVNPPVAVLENVTCPGASVCAPGVIGVNATTDGVTKHVVETTFPFASVTVSVYVFPAVSAGVGYDAPLTAFAVMSELPTPADPIVAVPPVNVGTSMTVALHAGVALLGTMLFANGAAGLITVSVAGPLVAFPDALVTTTVKTVPDCPAKVAEVE
jgi:hypothetical protein